LSCLSGGDAVKDVRVRHVATYYGPRDVCDPRLVVTQ
jgi:hypothetical protein